MTPKNTSQREAKEFGRRLRQLRVSRGYAKARHLATALELNENTYYRYERGLNVPSLQMLKLMCETLDVSICDLLPYKGSSHASGPDTLMAASASVRLIGDAPRQTCESRVEVLKPNQIKPDLSMSTDHLFLNCSMSAWSVAEITAELRGLITGSNIENVNNLALCASLYLMLKRDPFGTISSLIEEFKASGAETEVLERFRQSIQRFASSYRNYHEATQDRQRA